MARSSVTAALENEVVQRRLWQAASMAAAIGTGMLARNALKSLWVRSLDREPPENPADPSTQWREAVAWSAAIGAAVGVARVLGRRGAAAMWNAAIGGPPPGLDADDRPD